MLVPQGRSSPKDGFAKLSCTERARMVRPKVAAVLQLDQPARRLTSSLPALCSTLCPVLFVAGGWRCNAWAAQRQAVGPPGSTVFMRGIHARS